jgi:hypothetical protein
MPINADDFFAEKLGEQEVETRFAAGHIYGEERRPLVDLWLTRKRLAKAEAARAEEMAIALSSSDAAWTSAKEAKGANKRATVAIAISIVSSLIGAAGLVVAIVALLRKHG